MTKEEFKKIRDVRNRKGILKLLWVLMVLSTMGNVTLMTARWNDYTCTADLDSRIGRNVL